jgi:hypothetical protein
MSECVDVLPLPSAIALSQPEAERRFFINEVPSTLTSSVPQELRSTLRRLIDSFMDKQIQVYGDPRVSDFSVYTGTGGLALTCWHLFTHTEDPSNKARYLVLATHFVQRSLDIIERKRNTRELTFLIGEAGVYSVGTAVFRAAGDIPRSDACRAELLTFLPTCLGTDDGVCDELLYGRAGYLYALLFAQLGGCSPQLTCAVRQVAEKLLEVGRRLVSPSPLMYQWHKKRYLGAAHGLTGILYMLLQVNGFAAHPKHRQEIVDSLRFLTTQYSAEHFATKERTEPFPQEAYDEMTQWCHGAPAFAFVFMKAAEVLQDPQWLEHAHRAADHVWKYGLLKKGLGLCHGISGNGYVFLKMYQLTNDKRYYARAIHFARVASGPIGLSTLKTPDDPQSLFNGTAGACCFLADLLAPAQASFPGFDVKDVC